jgi:hypothetical protein
MDAGSYLASLPQWDGAARVAALSRDDVLAAEVSLPVAPGFTGRLAAVTVRRPYRAQSELIAVDVSRLPAS